MIVYLLSSRRNKDINSEITTLLESKGKHVHLPSRDTPQSGDIVMYEGNVGAIRKADEVLPVVNGPITGNWAFEYGYARALDKVRVCAILSDNDLNENKNRMIELDISKVKVINSIRELEKVFR